MEGGRPVPTGNFSFTVVGDVPFRTALRYLPFFVRVLGKENMVPGEKWTHAHARGVPPLNADGAVYDSDEASLLTELQVNPLMDGVQLCHPPFWLLFNCAQIVVAFDSIGPTVP